MTFEELLNQAVVMLQRQGRVAYRAFKRQFDLNDAAFDDLKEALLYAHPEVLDDEGRGLIWFREGAVLPAPAFPSALPAPRSVLPEGPPRPAMRPGELSPADAERRQLTVMFCDLVDSTPLAGQLDPEDYRSVVHAYLETCATVIQRFGGHIAKYLGDGILVYFGYPRADEHDAQRAVYAGLGMIEAIAQLNGHFAHDRGLRLAVRLGIHTGLVVAGELGSGTTRELLAIVGETPNIAARLQGVAEPNTVVISAATAQLVQGLFACEDLGTPPLKGVATPLRVYRVHGERASESRFEAVRPAGLTPLIGRDEELNLVLRRWAQATAGEGQVVLLTGEPGIGKSRLLEAVRAQAAAEPHARLQYQCSPYHTNSAFYPLMAQLARAAHFEPGDTPAQKLDKLESLLAQGTTRVVGVAPLVAALLSIPTGDRYPSLALSPQRQKAQTIAALVDHITGRSRRQPVLCLVEDAHWCDPTTLEVLERLVHRAPELRVLVLITSRPEFSVPWTAAHTTALTLTRLGQAQVAAMVAHLTSGKALPPEVLAQILDKTDGVPLFVEELTKTILESGLLREDDERYALRGPLPSLAIPATLQDSLMARLDRLAPVKEVAQLGAVLGREFTYAVLAAVSPRREPALSEALAQLVRAGLLFRRGQPPEAHYRFKHALVQGAAYTSLLKRTRQQLHRQIAAVLEASFPEMAEMEPEVLAHHYTEAGLPAQAIPYWQRAGERALARSAHREAVGSFEQALNALAHLPGTRETREQAIDLRLALRSALLPYGDAARILIYLREAEALAAALDDPRRLGQVSVRLSVHFYLRGAYDQAIAFGKRALACAMAGGDVVLGALANERLGIAYQAQGGYRRAIGCFGQTVTSLSRSQRRERFGQFVLPAVFSRACLASCHAELGTFAEGRTLGEEGVRIAEEVAHPGSLMYAYHGIGLLALRQGELPRALSRLERAMGLCQDVDLPLLFPWIAAALGATYALANELGMRPLQAHCHLGLGTLYATIGCSEQARAELSIAIELYQAMDMTFWLPQAEAGLAQVEGR